MKPPPRTSPRRSRPPRHPPIAKKLALGLALGLTISLPLAVMAAGDAHMELNPLLPNPPPFTTNLAPYASATVYIMITTPPEFTLISGPHVANPHGSANVLWTALGSGYTIVNTAPYKDWSKLEVSASWVKTNAPGGGVASGGTGENYDRFASALANLDNDWGIVWNFSPPVGQPVGAPINWTVAAFDSAGSPLTCSFSNVAGTGIHPAAYAASWTVTAGAPTPSSLSGTVVSDDPSTGKLKANYSCSFGSGTHTADSTLMFAKVGLAPVLGINNPEVAPKLCMNAQALFKTTLWQATVLPEGTTATFELLENNVSLTPAVVSHGGALLVALNDHSVVGNYKIRIKHSNVPTAAASAESTVFKFVFKTPAEFNECAPSAVSTSGNPQKNCDAHKVSAGTAGGGDKVVGALLYRSYNMTVITDPVDVAAVSVKATAKMSCAYTSYGKISKAQTEDGDTLGLGLGYGPISMGFSAAGTHHIGAFAAAIMAQFADGPTLVLEQDGKASTDFVVPGLIAPAATKDWTLGNSFIVTDKLRLYEVGVTKFPALVGVAVAARTTKDFGSIGIDPPTGVMVWQTTNATGIKPPQFQDDNDVFEIIAP